jgi:hypothetical protein
MNNRRGRGERRGENGGDAASRHESAIGQSKSVSLRPSRPPRFSFLRVFLAVVLFALLVRGGALMLMPGALLTDPDGYRRLAENLVQHGTFGAGDVPTAYRPPLYPLLLTGCVALGEHTRLAIGILHVLLGMATVGLTIVVARWWGLGDRAAALAGLLVACDPILLAQSAVVMTETLAVFLTAAGLFALTWSGRQTSLGRQLNCRPCAAMLAGAILALGALCRPALLLWTVAAGIGLALASSSRRPQPSDGQSATTSRGFVSIFAAFFLGATVVLGPWAVRNQVEFGRPIVTTTHGGYTLLLANNPEFYAWLRSGPWGSVWEADRFNADWDGRRPRDEVQANRQAYAEAWRTIVDAPATFVYACLVRVGRFWSPLPHQITGGEGPMRRLSRYLVGLWYLAEFALAAVGAWYIATRRVRGEGREAISDYRAAKNEPRQTSPPSSFPLPPFPSWLYGLLLVACLTAMHAVYWTDMRMRAPLVPLVAMAAAVGATARWANRAKTTTDDR